MALIRKLRTFWSLGPEVRVMALEAIALPVATKVLFMLVGVSRCQSALRTWAVRTAPPVVSLSTQEQKALIQSAGRLQRLAKNTLGATGTCLVRSLSLWAMLKRRGVDTQLRIGIRRDRDAVEGHAWLEFQGEPINESSETAATYVVFEQAAAFPDLRRLR